MTRTAKIVVSGVIALALCLTLLLVMLNTAKGSSPSLKERNTVTHYVHSGG